MYKVLACGSNGNYQLGINNDIDQNGLQEAQFKLDDDTIVTSLSYKPTKIACGGNHTLILFENGEVYTSGENQFGQCGLPKCDNITIFTKVPGNWIDCCCGWEFSILINQNREVYVCGNGLKGELGLGKEIRLCELRYSFSIPRDSDFEIKASVNHVVLRVNNELIGWGNCRKGQLGVIEERKPSILWEPKKLNFPNIDIDSGALKFSLGREYTCIFTRGEITLFGKHAICVDLTTTEVQEVQSMWSSVHFLTNDKRVKSFGNNSHGQLYPSKDPFKVETFAIGSEHGLVLSANIVYAWGWGEHGNCGIHQENKESIDEVTFNYLNPLYTAPDPVVAIAAGCATSWVVTKC